MYSFYSVETNLFKVFLFHNYNYVCKSQSHVSFSHTRIGHEDGLVPPSQRMVHEDGLLPTTSIPTLVPSTAPCASGWVENGGNCYLFNPPFNSGSRIGTWLQCNAYCLNAYPGSMMLCVNNAAENAWMVPQSGGDYWIGYTDMPPYGGGKGTKQYGWVSGCSSTYTKWEPNKPNNYLNNEDYALVDKNGDGRWNDETPQKSARCGCQYSTKI